MKKIFVWKGLLVATLAVALLEPASAQVPTPPKPVLTYPPGSPIPIPVFPAPPPPAPLPPSRDVYRSGQGTNRDGRVYRDGKPLPPGQAKKIYGDRSARNYAPGHNKAKRNGRDYYPPVPPHPSEVARVAKPPRPPHPDEVLRGKRPPRPPHPDEVLRGQRPPLPPHPGRVSPKHHGKGKGKK